LDKEKKGRRKINDKERKRERERETRNEFNYLQTNLSFAFWCYTMQPIVIEEELTCFDVASVTDLDLFVTFFHTLYSIEAKKKRVKEKKKGCGRVLGTHLSDQQIHLILQE
jgi:hypothetical protein